jgi:DNA-binding CsgD family transcriptional regulator
LKRVKLGERTALTPREREILSFIAYGYSARQVAQRIAIAPGTVQRHIENMRIKLGARNTSHLIYRAFSEGVLKAGEPVDSLRNPNLIHSPLTVRKRAGDRKAMD